MIAAANSVVALIDSSKFGKVNLMPFARADQVSHIFTDSDLSDKWISRVQQTRVVLTVCYENNTSDFAPHRREPALSHRLCQPHRARASSVDVRRGLERAAHEAGNIDLIIADNQLSGEVALEIADHFAAQNLDLVIEYQIDAQMGNRIMDYFRQADIPVIAVDIPMVGATFFGVDNYRAGYLAGAALGEWIKAHWDGHLDRLIVLEEPRAGALPGSRIQGMLEGVQSIIGAVPAEKRVTLNSGNTGEMSEAR